MLQSGAPEWAAGGSASGLGESRSSNRGGAHLDGLQQASLRAACRSKLPGGGDDAQLLKMPVVLAQPTHRPAGAVPVA